MAQNPTVLKIRAEVENLEGLNRLKTAVRRISQEVKASNVDFKKQAANLKELASVTKNSINNLRSQRDAFIALRDSVDVTSKEFKEATLEIDKFDKALAKAEGRKQRGGRLGQVAKGVGAIAGAGVFGGPEGALGSAIGLGIGGVSGAVVGGAIGAQVGQFRKALGAVAEYGAELNKLRTALRGVSASQLEFEQALQIITNTSREFAIPQEIITRQFTRLQASVVGAGGSIEDTRKTFRGIVAAVRATGGSLQDVDSALTATAQVFSKGKVSAEELRQQIGERLPGAFTIFADSIGLTPRELDKALEQGKVQLSDFLTFSEELFDRYYDTSQAIADGPDAAGDRLTTTLRELNEKAAPELSRLGAQFQSFAENAARSLIGLIDKLGEIGRAIETSIVGEQIDVQREALAAAQRTLVSTDATQLQVDFARDQIARLQPIIDAYDFIGPPAPSSGGITPEEEEDTLDPDKIKDITLADRNAQIALLDLRRKNKNVTLEQIKSAFDLKRIAAEELPINKRAVALKKIDLAESQAIQNLNKQTYQDLLDIANARETIANKQQNLNRLLIEGRVNAGEITEEEGKRLLAQDKINQGMKDFDILVRNGKISVQDLRAALGAAFMPVETTPLDDFKKGLKEIFEEAMNVKEALATAGVQAVSDFGDAFADFVVTGKASFADFTRSVLQDLARIFARAALFRTLSLIPGVGSFLGLAGFADGGVFAKNKIVPFAYGGVVNKPTLFPMANGAGLMGEAGPEAIMPLRRNSSGRLGVEASGGGTTTVNVSVDASGSSVEGDSAQAAQLGKAIGVAVQTEILKQKRPGGLLAGV